MIYTMTRDIAEILSGLEFPFPVVYGPRRTKHGLPDTEIMISRDREKGDTFAPAQGHQHNPNRVGMRWLGCVAVIHANSSLPGARINDHENLADELADGLQCALYAWSKAARSEVEIDQGRLVMSEELEAAYEQWPGVVYIMRFRVARGVSRRKYGGAPPLETATIEAMQTSATTVELPGGEPEDVS